MEILTSASLSAFEAIADALDKNGIHQMNALWDAAVRIVLLQERNGKWRREPGLGW